MSISIFDEKHSLKEKANNFLMLVCVWAGIFVTICGGIFHANIITAQAAVAPTDGLAIPMQSGEIITSKATPKISNRTSNYNLNGVERVAFFYHSINGAKVRMEIRSGTSNETLYPSNGSYEVVLANQSTYKEDQWDISACTADLSNAYLWVECEEIATTDDTSEAAFGPTVWFYGETLKGMQPTFNDGISEIRPIYCNSEVSGRDDDRVRTWRTGDGYESRYDHKKVTWRTNIFDISSVDSITITGYVKAINHGYVSGYPNISHVDAYIVQANSTNATKIASMGMLGTYGQVDSETITYNCKGITGKYFIEWITEPEFYNTCGFKAAVLNGSQTPYFSGFQAPSDLTAYF